MSYLPAMLHHLPHRRRLWVGTLLGFLLLALPVNLMAQPSSSRAAPPTLQAQLYRLESPSPWPEAAALLVVNLVPAPETYVYANVPHSPLGLPTVVTVQTGAEPLPAYYPAGVVKPNPVQAGQTVYVYDKPTRVFVPLAGHTLGTVAQLGASGLLCTATNCLPFNLPPVSLNLTATSDLPVAQAQTWWPETSQAQLGAPPEDLGSADGLPMVDAGEDWQLSPRYFQPGVEVRELWKAALLAILAGFILNFMPCVLPVASLKLKGVLTGFAGLPEAQRAAAFRRYNLAFAAGILTYFLLLAVILSSLGLLWGQIFQSPGVILGLTVLIFAMGLSLLGVFNLPIIDLKTPSDQGGHSLRGAFATGMVATLLATPCSGPFLGGVLAWTLIQPPQVIAAVFLCLGLGMAMPYLIMAGRPQLLAPFQKPGGWMIFLERLAAFFLFGTCLYLLQILPQRMHWPAIILLFVTAVAAWIWGGWTNLSHSALRRGATRTLAVALLAAAFAWTLRPTPPSPHWQPFEAQDFRARLGQERMLVDFTADWCPNCKFLEMAVLTDSRLVDWGRRYNLRYVKVDLTERHPEAQALLESLGSKSIPVVAIFPEGEGAASPLVLRDLFPPASMDDALQETFGPR